MGDSKQVRRRTKEKRTMSGGEKRKKSKRFYQWVKPSLLWKGKKKKKRDNERGKVRKNSKEEA